MKLSHYLVTQEFHDSEIKQVNVLVYSTRTNKFFSLTSHLYSLLDSSRFDGIDTDLLDRLKESKILVDINENEFEQVLSENIDETINNQTFYLVLQPSANCQLGCGYCGQEHKSKLMSSYNIEATVQFADRMLSEKNFNKFMVAWFGSEPLTGLANIKDLSCRFHELAAKYSLEYDAKIVTNGLLLSPRVASDLVRICKVSSFEITLDGDASGHDKRRHTKLGMPTFDRIFRNIKAIASLDLNFKISIRCNSDNRNKENVLPLLQQIKEAGLEKRVSFYVAPIHSWGNDAHTLAADQAEFAQWEIEWFIHMHELGFEVNPLPIRNKTVCMAVDDNAYLIDPSGTVFRCTEVSLVPQYEKNGQNIHAIGHAGSRVLRKSEAEFSSFNLELQRDKKYSCSQCNLLPICGGRCPKEWKEGRVACPPFKFNMHERLLLAYLLDRNSRSVQGRANV